MFSNNPEPHELSDLEIKNLGQTNYASTLYSDNELYTSDDNKIACYTQLADIEKCSQTNSPLPHFEPAGPRKNLFFNPEEVICGIVTCGGLCPGLNDVIRTITLTALWQYKAKKVLGFRYGYQGLSCESNYPPIEITPEIVNDIHHTGGTILGSSRGPQDTEDMVNTLTKLGVNMLFVIGGDGTLTGGHALAAEIEKQGKNIAVVGIPKTIDNDIFCCQTTFGYSTAVEEARKSIYAAHIEAKAAENGVGLVKLMGRDAGFIAAGAALANSDVNFCLVPEVSFALEGNDGFLQLLVERLDRKKHAVIVVAEGAGQYLFNCNEKIKDSSGNKLHKDIGMFLKEKIKGHFKSINMPVSIKYIDPSYTIRSCPANAQDSAFCVLLGQNAVHAAMAGKTDMFVGYWNNSFTHVPLCVTSGKRKKLDPKRQVLRTIITTTERVRAFSR